MTDDRYSATVTENVDQITHTPGKNQGASTTEKDGSMDDWILIDSKKDMNERRSKSERKLGHSGRVNETSDKGENSSSAHKIRNFLIL